MKGWLLPEGFENRMTGTETALGWLYLPMHAVVIPLLLGLYASVSPSLTSSTADLLWYGVGIVYVLCAMFRFLRGGFDTFLDAPMRCVSTMAGGLLLIYVFSFAVNALLLALLGDGAANPNNENVMTLARQDYGVTKAITIFAAPIIEETLFRGVVFGSLRPRSRFLACLVSAALFSLYHVWQYALAYGDPGQLIYALQYIPHALALAWCYDRTGSIWTPIFLHMGYNMLAFSVLETV